MKKWPETLKELMDSRIPKETQESLAEKIGVSQGLIGSYLRGEKHPRFKNLNKLASYFHVKPSELLEKNSFYKHEENLPRIDPTKRIKRNIPQLPLNFTPEQVEKFLKAWLNNEPLGEGITFKERYFSENTMVSEKSFEIRMTGDAMEPVELSEARYALYAGDILIIDPLQEPITHKAVYAKIDDHYQIRLFIQDGTQLKLTPLNTKKYKEIIIPNLECIKGVVVKHSRDYII